MCKKLARDEHGSVLVETTVMMTILFLFLLGAVDFLFAFYQWNAAAKAVHVGARLAAVSSPVANGLNGLSAAAVSSTVFPGDAMPTFTVTCTGTGVSTGTCTCSGFCTGYGSFDSTAMKRIVFGRDATSATTTCPVSTTNRNNGMCHMFSRITPANVQIVYQQTGLGYAGRPCGPVPTVTVSLRPTLSFQFFFLGGLMGFAPKLFPPLTTTVTGEDLSFLGDNPSC